MGTKTKTSGKITGIMLVVAIALLLCSGITGARSALVTSEEYDVTATTQTLSVAVLENGTEVADDGELLTDILGKDKTLGVGKVYDEELVVKNTGTIDQYARVSVYKYWKDGDDKRVDLDPDLIEVKVGDGWVVDESATTEERLVLYYTEPIAPGEESTPAVTGIKVDPDLARIVERDFSASTETDVEEGSEGTTITTTYTYDEIYLGLDADADAIQTHNAENAMKAAWGVDASVSGDGTLSL